MAKEGTSPRLLTENQNNWHKARKLIQASQYDKVATILHKAQITSEQTGNVALANTLAAARQICLAASQCQTEGDWHRQAFQEIGQREQELAQQLFTILSLVSENGAHEARQERTSFSPARQAGLNPPERHRPKSEARQGVFRRIQNILAWKLNHRSPDQEAPAASAEAATDILIVPPSKTTAVHSVEKVKQGERGSPSLVVYCLGPFRVYQDDQPVKDWPSSKGKAIFKYLITHRERPVIKEVLMELFWPYAHPDAARNNLNVAIYGLRQALREIRPSFSHVLFQDDCYLFNPYLEIWVDFEAFGEHLSTAKTLERRGDLVAATREYRAAEALYQGEFLEEDRYEDWLIPQRQNLCNDYLNLLRCLSRHYFDQEDYDACINACKKLLSVDACCENVHRRLMRCYSRQRQPYLALRQYHLCVEALKEELEMLPTQETISLYKRIRLGKQR